VKRILFQLLLVPFLCLGSADSGEVLRPLIHLLQYLAVDYPEAVKDGVVVNEAEYREQIEFVQSAIEMNESHQKTRQDLAIAKNLLDLKNLILIKAGANEIRRLAKETEARVIGISGIQISPPRWPDLKQGELSFGKNCASCHGAQGLGDGPSGRDLNPPPTNFHDTKMAGASAFQIFNTIRLGIPGTAMAGFSAEQMSDDEVWDLAYHIISLREGTTNIQPFTALAKKLLGEAQESYLLGNVAVAKQRALLSYLEGIEPVEPQLRRKNGPFTVDLEKKMAAVRLAIEKRVSSEELQVYVKEASNAILQAELLLFEKALSPTVTFSVAAGIFLREAFEAILLLVALLGVIRSVGSKKAALYVHSGWMLAVAVGLACWFFSGWVMRFSGLHREILEGIISLLAVGVLLYLGFWLHKKTEIAKWRAFLGQMAQAALKGKNLIALAIISFMAVFREAFETVLFLRALLLEAGEQNLLPLTLGVVSSFVLVGIIAIAILKFSARLPIRQLFDLSSILMILLAFILMGKAMHSFQEAGMVSMTTLPFPVRLDLVGVYPTYETLVPQLGILIVTIGFWLFGRRVPVVSEQEVV